MEVLRIVLFVLAILLIIATLIVYFKVRKDLKIGKNKNQDESKDNDKVLKEVIEKRVKFFTILTIITGVLCLVAIIFNIVFRDNSVATITMDINPSIEIKLDKDSLVTRVNALNEDAKKVIDADLKGKTINETLEFITMRLVEENYIHPEEEVLVILYGEGEVNIREVENGLNSIFDNKNVRSNVIVIENVSKEAKELARKNNISIGKAAYINEIIKNNENIKEENLIERPIEELNEIKETGMYCDSGYNLEGGNCVKEIKREKALSGKRCPADYYNYEGKCYEEKPNVETNEYECPKEAKKSGDKCTLVEKIEATANFTCEKGDLVIRSSAHYRKVRDKGDQHEYLCEDKSNAKAPVLRCLYNSGHIMINGKCYNGPAPLINGGCPGSDIVRNGGCYSKDNEDQWQCPNGDIYEKSKGTYVDLCPDTFTYTKASGNYTCPEGYTLNKYECERTREEDAVRIYKCPDGFTRLEDGRCINKNKTTDFIDGYYCDNQHARLEDDTCVIFDMVEAKHNS